MLEARRSCKESRKPSVRVGAYISKTHQEDHSYLINNLNLIKGRNETTKLKLVKADVSCVSGEYEHLFAGDSTVLFLI